MRWFVAGLAFAAVVGLAVATASVRVGNVAARARIQQLEERIETYAVSTEALRERYRRATRPEELLRMWRELDQAFMEASRT